MRSRSRCGAREAMTVGCCLTADVARPSIRSESRVENRVRVRAAYKKVVSLHSRGAKRQTAHSTVKGLGNFLALDQP